MSYKVEDKPKTEDKKEDKKEDKPALTEAVGEQVLSPAQWDEVQIEAAALFTRDAFSEPLDKEKVVEGVKKRREEYKDWEEKQAKAAEERSKKSDRS